MKHIIRFRLIFIITLLVSAGIFWLAEWQIRRSKPKPEAINQQPTTSFLDKKESISESVLKKPETEPIFPPETDDWQVATFSSVSLRIPSNWNTESNDTLLVLRPDKPALFEIERDPRITIRVVPASSLIGTSSVSEWFINEVQNNPERFDTSLTEQYGNQRIAFSEGIGEYPHRQYLLFHQQSVYWFAIEASDEAMHTALPLMVKTAQFSP